MTPFSRLPKRQQEWPKRSDPCVYRERRAEVSLVARLNTAKVGRAISASTPATGKGRHGAERNWTPNREYNRRDQRPPKAAKLKNHSKCSKSTPLLLVSPI